MYSFNLVLLFIVMVAFDNLY